MDKIHFVKLILEARVSSDRYHEKYEHCFNGKTSRRRSKVDPEIWKNGFPEDVDI